MGLLKNMLDSVKDKKTTEDFDSKFIAEKIVDSIGSDNIKYYDWCSTRVTIYAKDSSSLDISEIKPLIGGIIIKGEKVKYVVGPHSEEVAREIGKLLPESKSQEDDATHLAKALIPLLGGKSNIKEVDWCTTRLRLQIEDYGRINADEILKLVPGILERANGVQIIIGPEVESVANAMKELLPELPEEHLAGTLIRLLGGAMNIACFQWCFTKLRIKVNDKSKVQIDEIEKLTAGVIQNGRDIEIVIGNTANCIAEEIKRDIE